MEERKVMGGPGRRVGDGWGQEGEGRKGKDTGDWIWVCAGSWIGLCTRTPSRKKGTMEAP